MKVNLLVLLLCVLVPAGIGCLVWYLLLPSDEELIREAVVGMETTLSAKWPDDLPGQAENLGALKDLLGDEIRVQLPRHHYSGTFDRQRVLRDYFSIRNHFRNMKVVCTDVVVTFPGGTEKTASVALTALVTLRGKELPPYPLNVTMSKETGDWLVVGVEVVVDNKKTPAQ